MESLPPTRLRALALAARGTTNAVKKSPGGHAKTASKRRRRTAVRLVLSESLGPAEWDQGDENIGIIPLRSDSCHACRDCG